MNSVLFLGYSNLLKTRILPILDSLDIPLISIAKYKEQEWDNEFKKYNINTSLYDNYEDALTQFTGNIVYVSTVNSTHYQYALMGLEKGFNVIIDKPATMQLKEAIHLINTARQKKLLLSEATVYLMHPQFSLINDIYEENNDEPKHITAHFSMPPFKSGNFRYKKELGGGAILDTSPYAVSLGRYFFKDIPIDAKCVINERMENNLETSYSLLLIYNKGKSLIGHFGFNTEYINQLLVMGTGTNVMINRAYTIPDDMENVLHISHGNKYTEKTATKGNNFYLYLEKYLETLETGNYENSYSELLADAQAREMIYNNIL